MTANASKPPIEVIILAQGQQKRLPALTTPKQLLELPACAKSTIIDRTLAQLALIFARDMGREIAEDGEPGSASAVGYAHVDGVSVAVVCTEPLYYHVSAAGRSGVYSTTHLVMPVVPIELRNPGNSSLKGVATFLREQRVPATKNRDHRVVVLLGDVVYSWDCLRAILSPSTVGIRFVGSSDLSRSGGELWGLSWMASEHRAMSIALAAALSKHPPFDEYQPGQMRRWLWEIDATMGHTDVSPSPRRKLWFTAVDDYTRDIDIPQHVEMLPHLSRAACADDHANDLRWKESE